MAKKSRKVNQDAPSTLTIRLFDPGMSMLHRAGLGGLACTLRYIERAYEMGIYFDDEIPGGPWQDGKPPWKVEALQVTLDFGKPENAGEYIHRLFKIAFQIKDGLIYLPAQYLYEPPISVRAELQKAIQLTFLQHGPSCGSREGEKILSFEVNEGVFTISHHIFSSYKHQGWYWLNRKNKKTGHIEKKHNQFELINPTGCLSNIIHNVDNAIYPGAIVRHDSFKNSAVVMDDGELICAHFSLIGSIALCASKICGILIIPEVNDVKKFSITRPYMTPQSVKECQITNSGDAVLQLQIRLRVKQSFELNDIANTVITFRPTSWAKQLKSRVHSMNIKQEDQNILNHFEIVLAELPPRIKSKKKEKGQGRNKKVFEIEESFWVDSIIRPLIANNLATNCRWYDGFINLFRKKNSFTKKPLYKQIIFEKKGLIAMMNKISWNEEGESLIVNAVHAALGFRYGLIGYENKGNETAMQKRWSNEYDRWRIAFSGSKTAKQFRRHLCDLFSRAGTNPVLQEHWKDILPMLQEDRWENARDLTLLALSSYSGKGSGVLDELEMEDSEIHENYIEGEE